MAGVFWLTTGSGAELASDGLALLLAVLATEVGWSDKPVGLLAGGATVLALGFCTNGPGVAIETLGGSALRCGTTCVFMVEDLLASFIP